MNVDKYDHNHYYMKHFYHHRKFLCIYLKAIPSASPQHLATTDLLAVTMGMNLLCFVDGFFSIACLWNLSLILLVCVLVLLCRWVVFHCILIPQFLCFQFLGIMSKTDHLNDKFMYYTTQCLKKSVLSKLIYRFYCNLNNYHFNALLKEGIVEFIAWIWNLFGNTDNLN